MKGLEAKTRGALAVLEKQATRTISLIETGKIRRATYLGPGRYRFSDPDWECKTLPIISKPGETLFFRGEIALPAARDREALCLRGNFTNAEGLFLLNGDPYCGVDARHRLIFLPRCDKGSTLSFEIELFFVAHPCFDSRQPHSLLSMELVQLQAGLLEYYYNLGVAFEAWQVGVSGEREWLETAIQDSLRRLDLDDTASVAEANRVLQEGIFGKKRSSHDFSLALIGHSHIDTAWLWPIAETIRKCGRTFATALRLMEMDPGFVFSASQPQQYQFAKEHYPEIYRQIKDRVAEGRWEPLGALWVEPDCNVVSGESLVRQILYGKKFFMEEFGESVHTAWLPDTFGFTASLPQILKESGVGYFYTNKIYWQSENRFPHSLFWWEGIDGSRILAHTPKLRAYYNGSPNPCQFKEAETEFQQKGSFPKCLFPFGHGDGGGGVTREMLAYAKRLADFPGLPRSEFSRVEDYFKEAEGKAKNLPVWRGELYLETHQGCFTSQAKTKKNNRTAEKLLYTVELLQGLEVALTGEIATDELADVWQRVLTFQFHDILPGSSIAAVYREIEPQYQEIISKLDENIRRLLSRLARRISFSKEKGESVLLFNPLNWERNEIVEVRPGVVVEINLPACGYRVCYLNDKEKGEKNTIIVEKGRLENRYFSVRLNNAGRVGSLYDKVNAKEVLSSDSPGNDFLVFRDGPLSEEAWNIDPDYKATARSFGQLESSEVIETGPVRGILRQTFRDGKSVISQDIIIYENLPRIDFRTHVDWQERRKMLKVAFPVAVEAKEAFYEIPFGAVSRPTTNRDSWETAKEEVPALRWADLSSDEYGVSLLNDSKYGYDIKGNTIRLTLLRAPTYPDPESDKGKHEFTYSLFPHNGDWRNAEVVKRGYELNQGVLVCPLGPDATTESILPEETSFLQTAGLPVVVSAFKCSEDGKGCVVRFYEPNGRGGEANVTLPALPREIWETSLLEERKKKVSFRGKNFVFSIAPFQIKTFLCEFDNIRLGAKQSQSLQQSAARLMCGHNDRIPFRSLRGQTPVVASGKHAPSL